MEEGIEQDTPKDADNSPVRINTTIDELSIQANTADDNSFGTEEDEKLSPTRSVANLSRKLLWIAVFGLTATVSATLGAAIALIAPLSPLGVLLNSGQKTDWHNGFQYRLGRPVNILVMGIDRVPDVPEDSPAIFNGHSDTMLLLRLEPKPPESKGTGGSAKLLSIPRDTRVESAGLSLDKINQANADGGSALAARVVSRTLNNVPIDRYIRITTGAFRELVDLVGGVEVFVPRPMHYVDETQNLHINLEPGWQTLNGEQAEQFARFRHDVYGDVGRVQRQQILFKALRQRLQNPTVLALLPQAVRVMWKYVDTNLSMEETLALVNFGLGLEPDDIKMVILPGRYSEPKELKASYWLMDSAGKDRVMTEYFGQDSQKERNSAVRTISGIDRSLNQARIAIQNATKQPHLGQQFAKYLGQKGFRNIYVVKDWPDPQRQTQIIVQQGDLKAATELKRVLGFGKVEASSTGDLESDFTIRVGEDWTLR